MKNNQTFLKYIAAIVLALLISFPGMAQDDREEISTLFGDRDGNIHHGGWGGLTFGYTKIKGNDTYLMGARGGWLIDHHFTIGFAGNGFITDQEFQDPHFNDGDPYNLAGGYGGLFLEAVIAPYFPVHVSIPVIIGAGGVAFTDQRWYNNDWEEPGENLQSDAFFVLEPGIELEVNLIKFMRLGIGGSYRYTSNVKMGPDNDDMLRGFNGNFSLKFGWF